MTSWSDVEIGMADEPEAIELDDAAADHADGTDDVLEALFRSSYRDLLVLARLLVDRPEDAEEVVQEAFARALASWPRVRDKQHPAPYLRTVVVNVSRDRLRRRRVRRQHDLRADRRPPSFDPPDGSLRPGDSDLADALHALPRRQRECVVLRFAEGCSTSQTASILGISEGSVKTHLHRGLSALQAQLEQP